MVSSRAYPPSCSERVNELRVLPIREIHPFLVLELHILRLGAQESFLCVLSPAVPVDEQHIHETNSPAADDRDLGRDVARRVLRPECLGSDDVADTRW